MTPNSWADYDVVVPLAFLKSEENQLLFIRALSQS